MKTVSMVQVVFCGLIAATAAPSLEDQVFITAAINWPGDKAQFFLSDGTYIRYDVVADRADPGYPRPVTNETWPGLGGRGKQIVAATRGLDPNKTYFFFADRTYARYDIGKDRVDEGYPQPITDRNWPGLAAYSEGIFGAMNWPGDRVQFFLSNGTYIRYDLRADRVDPGYPRPIDDSTWPGLARYASHISACINWSNGKAYIFLDDGRYLRYDIAADSVDDGYPKPVDNGTWPGLGKYFRRR